MHVTRYNSGLKLSIEEVFDGRVGFTTSSNVVIVKRNLNCNKERNKRMQFQLRTKDPHFNISQIKMTKNEMKSKRKLSKFKSMTLLFLPLL